MEYVQLEGIHIHEDGYAKFIELTLSYSLLNADVCPYPQLLMVMGEHLHTKTNTRFQLLLQDQ